MLKVPDSSKAGQVGLVAGDVVQAVNGRAVSNVKEFKRLATADPAAELRLKVIRDQQPTEVIIRPIESPRRK